MHVALREIRPGSHKTPQPAPGLLDVYILNKGQANDLSGMCADALTAEELHKADYFKTIAARDNYIISQGMLRILLGTFLKKQPADVRIAHHSKGKPYCEDDISLRFNISNSGGLCAFAFSMDGELGIDIENIRALDDLDDLIQRNFTRAEAEWICGEKGKKSERFFQFWTVKEAYLKAIGEGMRLTPDNLEFSVESGRFSFIAANGLFEPDDWQIATFNPCQQYAGAVVHRESSASIRQIEILL